MTVWQADLGLLMASGLGGSAMHSEKYSLTEAFREKSPDEARQLYDDWATGYDRDNLFKGYRLPWMAAAYAARLLKQGSGPILDSGCGTGLSPPM